MVDSLAFGGRIREVARDFSEKVRGGWEDDYCAREKEEVVVVVVLESSVEVVVDGGDFLEVGCSMEMVLGSCVPCC